MMPPLKPLTQVGKFQWRAKQQWGIMMRATTWIMIALVVSTKVAHGQTASVMGFGVAQCHERPAVIDGQISAAVWQYRQWVLGFLSGAAIFGERDTLHGRTGSDVIGWIDDYCDSHPSDTIEQAVVQFIHAHTALR